MLYIFTSYCLIGPVIESFRKNGCFRVKTFEMSFPNCSQQNLTFTSPQPASHVHYLRAAAQNSSLRGFPGPKNRRRFEPPVDTSRWLKPPTWTRQMARRPGQQLPTGNWNVQVDVFLPSWRWGSIPPFSGFWSYIVASITHPLLSKYESIDHLSLTSFSLGVCRMPDDPSFYLVRHRYPILSSHVLAWHMYLHIHMPQNSALWREFLKSFEQNVPTAPVVSIAEENLEASCCTCCCHAGVFGHGATWNPMMHCSIMACFNLFKSEYEDRLLTANDTFHLLPRKKQHLAPETMKQHQNKQTRARPVVFFLVFVFGQTRCRVWPDLTW